MSLNKAFTPVTVTAETLSRLAKEKKYGDLLALYMACVEISVWQGGSNIQASRSFMMKRLSWGEQRLNNAKQTLIAMDLLEPKVEKDKKGKVLKHYILVKHVVRENPLPSESSAGVHHALGFEGTNTNKLKRNTNKLKNNNIVDFDKSKKTSSSKPKSTQSTFGEAPPPKSAPAPPSKKQSEKELLDLVNRITGRSFRVFGTKSGVGKTLKIFSLDEVETALTSLVQDSWHRSKLKEFSIDYFIRATTIDKFLSQAPKGATQARVPDHYDDEDGNSYWKGELVTPENQERILKEQMS